MKSKSHVLLVVYKVRSGFVGTSKSMESHPLQRHMWRNNRRSRRVLSLRGEDPVLMPGYANAKKLRTVGANIHYHLQY